jgi:cholesterol transport system auxiliary component
MKKPSFVFGLALFASVVVLGATGCALLSKSDVVRVRYFSPEVMEPRVAGVDAGGAGASAQNDAIAVRLGRVYSGPNLRERIAYRDDAYELGYYDDWRWTERPETFVRRALGRSLFEVQRFRRVLGGAAPTLEVEVVAFDDLRLGTSRAARVQLKVILFEDAGVVFEDTVAVDRAAPADKPKIEDVVAAMAVALDAASQQVAVRVGTELGKRRPVTTK